jgi:TRAP-type uncharacterized transport system substrate-binding protein
MQEVIGDVSEATAVSEANFPLLKDDRVKFAAEHAAVAEHQAKWTASDRKRGYDADVRAIFNMHNDNYAWRKQVQCRD